MVLLKDEALDVAINAIKNFFKDDDLDFEEDSVILSGDDIEDQDDYEVWKRYIDGND